MIVVLGSVNADRICRVPSLPKPGETLLATSAETRPGGKGRNQAAAIADLGGKVRFSGAVGSDGAWLVAELADRGVDVSGVAKVGGTTGFAAITVEDSGENTIVVDPGANAAVTAVPKLTGADVLLCSLEVPLETVEKACAAARSAGVRTVVNAAPMHHDLDAILELTDVLVVNETEARALLRGHPDDALVPALDTWRGDRTVVLTVGPRGAVVVGGRTVPSPKVDVVSTVGAGDAFVGALALALADGLDVDAATDFACAAGALAVSGAKLTRAATQKLTA